MLRIHATIAALIVAFVVFPPIIRANQKFDPNPRPTQRSGLPRSGEAARSPIVVATSDDEAIRTTNGKPATSVVVSLIPVEDDALQTQPFVADGLGLRAPPLASL
jgi:hypothetical protein